MRLLPKLRQAGFVAVFTLAVLFLTGCATAEPRPTGVSQFISFTVTPIYPKSFEIIALSFHSIYGHFGEEELREGWRKKALQIANGRRFKASPLIVHNPESDLGGWPSKSRTVAGTITLVD